MRGSGGDAVYEALQALGVRHVFGIPSQQNLALYDAFARRGGIELVGARHEQGAVHAADGYARTTGRLGVAIVSTGPGTTNAVSGLYEAGFASSPVLLITTQIDRCWLGKGKGFIHEADNQLAMLRTVTRRAERVEQGDAIAGTILSLAREALSGRPQPVAVEIPTDLLAAPADPGALAVLPPLRPVPDEALLMQAAERLMAAQRPLLWLGGGAQHAAPVVRRLAERLGCPVVSSNNGRGVVASDDPLYVGNQTHYPQFRPFLEQADLVLAIGARFQAVPTWYWSLPVRHLIHIDADPGVLNRSYPADLAIAGDAGLAAERLLALLPRPPSVDPTFRAAATATKAALRANVDGKISAEHKALCDIIDLVLPADRNIVCDATLVTSTWGYNRLPIRQPRSAVASTSMAIGPALPLGIGAALGTARRTLVMHGDGGVMLSLGEIATAVDAKAPVILCIFNDRGYGILRHLQANSTQRQFAVDLHTPNFHALGLAMGVPSAFADSPASFEEALSDAVRRDGPTLIEIDLTALGKLSH